MRRAIGAVVGAVCAACGAQADLDRLHMTEMELRLDGERDDGACVRFRMAWDAEKGGITAEDLRADLDGVAMDVDHHRGLCPDDAPCGQARWVVGRDRVPPAPGIHVVTIWFEDASTSFRVDAPAASRHLRPVVPLREASAGDKLRFQLDGDAPEDSAGSENVAKAWLAMAGADRSVPRLSLLTDRAAGKVSVHMPEDIAPGDYMLYVGTHRALGSVCPADACWTYVRAHVRTPLTVPATTSRAGVSITGGGAQVR